MVARRKACFPVTALSRRGPGGQGPGWLRSGRAMARTGLRMMPTFPSPSLKFRTAGSPQYGFKASLSGRACPSASTVKPAPGMPAPAASLSRPVARFRTGAMPWLCVQASPGLHGPLCERPLPLYHRGSGPGSVVPVPHRLLRPHPPVSPARGDFAASPLIPHAFAVRERLGDPRDLPYFPSRAVHTCRRPYAGGSAAPSRCVGTAMPGFLVLPASRHPQDPSLPAIPDGVMSFGAASFASCCGPYPCPVLRTGSSEMEPRGLPPRLLRHRVTPAIDGARRRAPLGVRLEGRTGNLPSSGLSPDQFAAGSEAAR